MLERIIKFFPAYDKSDPDPSKNYGIHGVDLLMVVKGDEGAVQFKLFTNWMLPHVQAKEDARVGGRIPHLLCHPMPADLGYHSKVARYDGQRAMGEESISFAKGEDVALGSTMLRMPKVSETGTFTFCEYTGGKCYYDGSTLNAERIYQVLLTEGSDGVWRELEGYYRETFNEEGITNGSE